MKVTQHKQIFYLNFEFAQSQGSRLLGTKQFLLVLEFVIAKFFKLLQEKKCEEKKSNAFIVYYINPRAPIGTKMWGCRTGRGPEQEISGYIRTFFHPKKKVEVHMHPLDGRPCINR